MEINEFTDWTFDEFDRLLGADTTRVKKWKGDDLILFDEDISIDWSEFDTPVRH